MHSQPIAIERSIAFALWLFVILPLGPALAAPRDFLGDKCDQIEIVRQELQRKGQAQVIVELSSPVTAAQIKPGDTVTRLKENRSRIQALQDRFLSKHFGHTSTPLNAPGPAHRRLRRFELSPLLATTVSGSELEAMAADPDVARIYPDRLDFPSLQDSVPLIGMTDPSGAYAAGATGIGQAVAIVDTGIQASHPFLIGKVIAEACFSTSGEVASSLCPNGLDTQTGPGAAEATTLACMDGTNNICGHGTHVAGIAAGNNTNPGIPPNGVAKSANIVAIQVFTRFSDPNICGLSTSCVASYTSDQLAGLEWIYSNAANLPGGIKLASVNMSLGGGKHQASCDSDPRKPYIDALRSVGVSTAIASGNDRYSDAVNAPGCISTAVTVGATTLQDTLASYSNQSPLVDLLAPGTDIYSSIPFSIFEYNSGTSMATPHVAGSFAAIKSLYPDATVDQIEEALKGNGIPIANRIAGSYTKPRIQVDQAIEALTRHLTVINTPGGRITSTPQGIDCGGTCTFGFLMDSNVTLSANPSEGFRWSEWGGACSGKQSNCMVKLTSDQQVQANFLRTYTLDVSLNGQGHVLSRPVGIDCGTSCATSFDADTAVSLEAVPGLGYRFDGWQGDCAGAGVCILTMDANKRVTANFIELPKYLLKVTKSNQGTVVSTPDGIDCGKSGNQCKAMMSDVTLVAKPRYGYGFKKWIGCPNPQENACVMQLGMPSSISAKFSKLKTFPVKITKTRSGTIDSVPPGLNCKTNARTCKARYPVGTQLTLTATPDEGRRFAGWDGDCSGRESTCALFIDSKKLLSATFE